MTDYRNPLGLKVGSLCREINGKLYETDAHGSIAMYHPITRKMVGYIDVFPCYFCGAVKFLRGNNDAFRLAMSEFPHKAGCCRAEQETCEDLEYECEMEVQNTVSDFHDPSQYHGHGQIEGKILVCKYCGRTDDYEPSDPEPYED